MPYGTVNADTLVTSTSGGILGAKNASTLQNRLINAGFAINQRGYVSGTALSAGAYAHDRFKAGASGCTYTFTQGSLGVPIVITITAGSLQQVIEGCNMPDGGTYVLSWTGTAQARFNSGTYGSSPLAVTGITAGANTTIEFNAGTLSYPQLEVGSSATGFEYRMYGTEFDLCRRYFESFVYQNSAQITVGTGYSTSAADATVYYYPKRAIPTITLPATGSGSGQISYLKTDSTYPSTIGTVSAGFIGLVNTRLSGTGYTSAWSAGNALWLYAATNATIQISAEL